MNMRIGLCPYPKQNEWDTSANPHIIRILQGLQVRGWDVVDIDPTALYKLDHLKDERIDILYFHWATSVFPLQKYRYYGINQRLHLKLKKIKGIRRIYKNYLFLHQLLLARLFSKYIIRKFRAEIKIWSSELKKNGIPIIWHQHDLLSHHLKEEKHCYLREIDRILHYELYDLSTALVIHEESCKKAIFDFYGYEKKTILSQMGPFQNIIPIEKADARDRLKIRNNKVVFLYNGTSRKNRNPNYVIELFRREYDNNELVELIVASRNCLNFLKKKRLPNNIRIFNDFISSDEIRDLFCASDFLILDAKNYLTSAVIRTAIYYSLPVIAENFGSTTDLAKNAIFPIYPNGKKDNLSVKIKEAINISEKEYNKMVAACKKNNESRTWDRSIDNLSDAFLSIAKQSREEEYGQSNTLHKSR